MPGLAFPTLTPDDPEAVLSPATTAATNDDIPIDPALNGPLVQVRSYFLLRSVCRCRSLV